MIRPLTTLDRPAEWHTLGGILTPEGREFLLKTIADGQVEMPRRMACAAALPYQGVIENPPGTFLRDPHYLSRLAQAATAAEKTPALAAAIVGHIGGDSQPDDLNDAIARLGTLHAATDDFLRYAIEGTLARGDPGAYQKLQPIGGPVVATVRFNPPEAQANAMPRTTRVLLRYDCYFPDRADHIIATQYILHATDTGKVYEGPIDPTSLDPRRDFNAADRDIVVPRARFLPGNICCQLSAAGSRIQSRTFSRPSLLANPTRPGDSARSPLSPCHCVCAVPLHHPPVSPAFPTSHWRQFQIRRRGDFQVQ